MVYDVFSALRSFKEKYPERIATVTRSEIEAELSQFKKEVNQNGIVSRSSFSGNRISGI